MTTKKPSSENKKDTFWTTYPANIKAAFARAFKYSPKIASSLIIINIIEAAIPFVQFGAFALIIENLTKQLEASSTIAFTQPLVWLVVLQIASLVLPSIIYRISGTLETIFRFVFIHKLNIDYLQKLASLDLGRYEHPDFHNKLQKAAERGPWSYETLFAYARIIGENLLVVIIAGVILLSIHWLLLVGAVVAAVPAFIIQSKFGKATYWIWDHDAQTRRLYFDRRSHFTNIELLKELKLFQMNDFFLKQVDSLLGTFTDKQVNLEKKKLGWELLGVSVFTIGMGGSIVFMIHLTVTQAISLGAMTFVFSSLQQFQSQLGSLFRNLGGQREYNSFATDFRAIFNTGPALAIAKNPLPLAKNITPTIEFKDVWFKYPGTEKWILKNINLIIKPGESLAIVGVNGAGKTTLVKLLNRFYDPTKGDILIDGVSLKQIDPHDYQAIIATLFQDFATYQFIVKEAIALGRTENPYNEKQMHKAAKLSQSDVFIEKLDNKYDQMLGKRFEDGIDLSGGQNQRMALARVFYRDANIIILDEPTASVDAEAEMHIFESITKEFKNRTVITISHRFSTVRQSDTICVLKDGSVHEYGCHKDLMKLGGTYAGLYTKQAKAFLGE